VDGRQGPDGKRCCALPWQCVHSPHLQVPHPSLGAHNLWASFGLHVGTRGTLAVPIRTHLIRCLDPIYETALACCFQRIATRQKYTIDGLVTCHCAHQLPKFWCRQIPGYPRIDRNNDYLVSRFDGLVLDAKPWTQLQTAGPGGETPASAASHSEPSLLHPSVSLSQLEVVHRGFHLEICHPDFV